MVKCFTCAKLIDKKSPSIQCGKCSKRLHGVCANISNEHLTFLSTTDSVDWKCKVCMEGSKRRLSCIVPDDVGDLNFFSAEKNCGTTTNSQTHKTLRIIRQEVKEIIKQELHSMLEYYSDKIDEYENKIKIYEKNMKIIDNQCMDLKNNYKNLNLKYEVLQIKTNQLEQKLLSNQLEIVDVEEQDKENINSIVQNLAEAIHQNPDNIISAYRKKKTRSSLSKRHETSAITVNLREGTRDLWLQAGKSTEIQSASIGMKGNNKIYISESLTRATAYLLWKTKEEFKNHFKYIWCKNGSVLIRKNEKGKAISVSSLQDIVNIKATLSSTE